MIAIILAGGKGTRFEKNNSGIEKPLLEINGTKLIDYVINAIKNSVVEDLIIAASPFVPKTEAYCKKCGLKVIETPGAGYHEDIKYLLKLHPVFLSVVSDIPFLTSDTINTIIKAFDGNSLTACVPLKIVPKNIEPAYLLEHNRELLVPIGVNIVTKHNNSRIIKFDNPLLAININSIRELEIAGKILCNR
jgi:adenosylcobinamide-phosphate guanylyltransferase